MRYFALGCLLLLSSLAYLSAQPIADQYIVMLKPSTGLSGLKLHLANVTSSSLWNSNSDFISARWAWEELDFFAYSATLTSKDLVVFVANSPDVIGFESDQEVHIDACVTSGSLASGLWGLSRVSYRDRQPVLTYHYNNQGDGQGVDAYIIDTGIYTAHSDFQGRARIGFNAFPSESPQDLNGHGTHCAGTVAGFAYGIAKQASLISVKVLDKAGSGTNTGIINGIDWLISNLHPTRACVTNMSLGGGYSAALNTAVNRLVAAGCFTAVAAGNSNANACNTSPASASEVYTVMSTTNTDLRSSFSNFGTCCKIFAPGTNILSDWIGSTTATNTISGTSMASPHVCGVAASRLSLHPAHTPRQVADWMTGHASDGRVQSPGTGSPNKLLFQGCL